MISAASARVSTTSDAPTMRELQSERPRWRGVVILAWLLMPGASKIAGRLRWLADTIDEVVAGQLWIRICDHDPAGEVARIGGLVI